MKKLLKDSRFMSALSFLVLLGIIGACAEYVACSDCWISFDPQEVSAKAIVYSPPGSRELSADGGTKIHILGTDQIGRDVASRLIHGISVAFKVGIWSSIVAMIIALVLGGLSGYAGNRTHQLNLWQLLSVFFGLILAHFYAMEWAFEPDERNVYLFQTRRYLIAIIAFWLITFIMVHLFGKITHAKKYWVPWDAMVIKGIEVFRSIPRLFFLLAIFAIITRPSLWSVIIIIGLIRWPALTRLIRAEIISIKQEDYIRGAKLLGLSGWRIFIHHVLPNIYKPILVLTAFNMGSAILIEATLSFLDIGLPMDAVSWGRMLGDARDYIPAWWMAIGPGFLIFSLILCFNVIGNRLSFHFRAIK